MPPAIAGQERNKPLPCNPCCIFCTPFFYILEGCLL
jgi:hypothetical protein